MGSAAFGDCTSTFSASLLFTGDVCELLEGLFPIDGFFMDGEGEFLIGDFVERAGEDEVERRVGDDDTNFLAGEGDFDFLVGEGDLDFLVGDDDFNLLGEGDFDLDLLRGESKLPEGFFLKIS